MRPEKRGWAGFLRKLAVAALLVLATLSLAMMLTQADLLFPTHAVPKAGPLPAGAERMQVVTRDGDRLEGVHFGPKEAGDDDTLILGFGGNAWNGQHVAMELHRLFPKAHVVAFHYRGYSPSAGKPSAKALLEDAPLVYDAVVERIRPRRIVAVGFSIGSAVAANLARDRQLDGAILVTPFDSLKAVTADLYPWLPVGLFFQHEMDASGALRQSSVPVAIIAADRDEIISSKRTDVLRRTVPNLAFDRTIVGAGHNDLYDRREFAEAMQDGFAAIVTNKK